MAETYLTIQEASTFAGRSIQTIRRALKAKKLTGKRQKTPQGFNYMIDQEELIKLYKLKGREHSSLRNSESTEKSQTKPVFKTAEQTSLIEYASKDELGEYKKMLDQLMVENQKDKETFTRFVKLFQDRFTALENQMKLLEEPKKNKKWFHFWK